MNSCLIVKATDESCGLSVFYFQQFEKKLTIWNVNCGALRSHAYKNKRKEKRRQRALRVNDYEKQRSIYGWPGQDGNP